MLYIKIDNNTTFELDPGAHGINLNGKPVKTDIIKLSDTRFHLLVNDRSLTIELLKKDPDYKRMEIAVNGLKHEVAIATEHDHLLKELGMDKLIIPKINDLKAPMPGLVLQIKVKEGDKVQKGDALLVLEAMKMENVIKAPADAVIKKINISERKAVEKNQVLIVME